MTALYFHSLRAQDRIAVKPHASPVMHAIQYLLGNEDLHQLKTFRGLGGAQSYPSRTKDRTEVDFSTGSVGLGVAATLFASIAQDYVSAHRLMNDDHTMGRMIAIMGDAELDEGNVYEALLEGWKHDIRNLWWIIDYNRQSLDGVVNDELFHKIEGFFSNVGWNVVTLKFGRKLEAARHGPAGEALLRWIETCPNQLYSALTFKGGASWRDRLRLDLRGAHGLKTLLDQHDDASLSDLMTNLGGHDLETILDAFDAANGGEAPHCFVAYTIKGYGLPLQGHKDNHAGLMNPNQLAEFQRLCGVPAGQEWDPFAGLKNPSAVETILQNAPIRRRRTSQLAAAIPVESIAPPLGEALSTQEAFGKILFELARERTALSQRIVTTSPDVTVSTNLSGWVNRRGVFHSSERADTFQDEKIASPQKWRMGPGGQHIELGIAENNLFLMLGQLGLADRFWGERLLPIGTVYDPFINRGLDALIYACYQGARFMIVATPSGVTLAAEGGAHQSINTPLIGMAQDGLSYFEPAYADELALIMGWAFDHMQAEDGGSVYLRLTTRSIEQLPRTLTPAQQQGVIEGAYWLRQPSPSASLAIAYLGAVAPEAHAAVQGLLERNPGMGILAVTSPDRLHSTWRAAQERRQKGEVAASSAVEDLLEHLAPDATLVSVLDGHPATLSWLGAVYGHPIQALGVEKFGQSADLQDLYALNRIDAASIVAAARAPRRRPSMGRRK